MSTPRDESRSLLHRFLRPRSVQQDLESPQDGSDTTLKPAPLPNSGDEVLANVSPDDGLWQKAMYQLPDPEQKTLLSIVNANTRPDLLQLVADITQQKSNDLQRSRSKFTISFNNKKISLRDLLVKIIHWANKFKQIGDVVVNFDPVHAALPWAAVRFLLEALTLGSDQAAAILIGLEKVAYLTSRCKLYESLYITGQQDEELPARQAFDNLNQALILLYSHLLRFLALICRICNKSSLSQGAYAITHPDQITSFLKQSDDLASRVESETRNCDAITSRQNAIQVKERDDRLRDLLAELEQPLVRIDSTLAKVSESIEREERNKILHWISAIPYEDRHQTACADRLVGTGGWLLDSSEFISWRDSSSSMILWLHGSPGTGKTKLASNVADCLKNSFDSRPNNEAFLYFYCSRNQADARDPNLILGSLLRQISTRKDLSVPKNIHDAYQEAYESGFAATHLSYEQIQELFTQSVAAYAQVSIVVDALDECETRTRAQLMSALERLVDESEGLVKIFVSSRPDRDIKSRLEKHTCIELTATSNQQDITLFVNRRMVDNTYWPSGKFSKSLTEEVKSTLIRKSDGMFQWASLQLNELSELFRESDILESLGRLPQGLSNTYGEIYGRIKSQKGSAPIIADRAFQWIMASLEPIPPDMLAEVVCYDLESDRPQKADLTFEDVRTACRNLLVLDETQNVCKFSHLSVQEYLEEHHHNLALSNLNVSKTCLINLVYSESSRITRLPLKVIPRGLKAVTLDRYSRSCWPMHLGLAESLGFDDRLVKLTQKFFGMTDPHSKETSPYQRWAEFVSMACRPSRGELTQRFDLGQFLMLDPITSIAFPMCVFGICGLVRTWWETAEIDVGQINTRGRSLLWLASAEGHHAVVRELLRRGAEPGDEYRIGQSPLVAAARQGHIKVVEVLTSVPKFTPDSLEAADALCQATVYNREASVRLLLKKGVSVNAIGSFNESGWNSAINIGNESTIQMMLECGADVDSLERHEVHDRPGQKMYSCVLTTAIAKRHDTIARMLLERGADVNGSRRVEELGGTSKLYTTPLQTAAKTGNRDIVLELLNNGADVNAQSVLHVNALEAVLKKEAKSQDGSTNIATLLIERGADINADFGPRWISALHLAAINGHSDAVSLLIKKGMDVDTDQGSKGTPLQFAAAAGCEEVVRMLLLMGADAKSEGTRYGSALVIASTVGHKNVIRLLFQQGVDLFVENGHLLKALEGTIKTGRVELMSLLISEINKTRLSEYIQSRAFLGHAFRTKFPEAARAIYLAGSELAQSTDFGLTPLHTEVKQIHIPFIESQPDLMEIVIRPIVDKRGFTALHIASISGSRKYCEWLINTQPQVDSKDNELWTPLHWASYAGRDTIVELLLTAGAQRDAKTKEGLTPYNLAEREGHSEVLVKLYPTEDTDLRPEPDANSYSDPAAGDGRVHCDSCDLSISREAFHCTECPDVPGFDLCFRCIKDVHLFHPPHVFNSNWTYSLLPIDPEFE